MNDQQPAKDPTEDRMIWRGRQSDALFDTHRELDIEGALRASKTTICLRKEMRALYANPGMHGLIGRWTDDATHGILKPAWRAMCQRAGIRLQWNGEEQYDQMDNGPDRDDPFKGGSLVYIRGLKTQDQTNRYSKFRGLTLARVYIDQAEEMPKDVYQELAARLSQAGYTHQITISPNAVEETHWIALEFPNSLKDGKDPHRGYIPLSVHDNAHNLSPEVIPALTRIYPVEHPKHRTMVLGLRGMNVTGDPVYKGSFIRQVHEKPAEFDPRLPLDMALDFGKHHPCVVFRQTSVLGQLRFLGGILGQQLYLDDFIDIVLRYRAEWFPHAVEIRECCDPAGTADTSHGTKGAVELLKKHKVFPRSVPASNSPIVRLAVIERMAGKMRERVADRSEAVVVSNSERWLRISEEATVIDPFLADGFEAGYVWDKHLVSVDNKQVRKPLKDGWFEHGQNCAEYLELNFGIDAPKKRSKRGPSQGGRTLHPGTEADWLAG